MGIWYTVLAIFHVIVCLFLITVVLLQQGKGGGMGVAFGGGTSGSVFGARGAGSFLGRLTAIGAAVFFLNSIMLAYMSSSARGLFRETAEAAERDDATRPALAADASVGDGDTSEANESEESDDAGAAEPTVTDGAAAADGAAAPDGAAAEAGDGAADGSATTESDGGASAPAAAAPAPAAAAPAPAAAE